MESEPRKFFSLGSGPVRSIVQKEEIFKELNYKDKSTKTSVVLEVDKFPPEEVVKKVSQILMFNQKFNFYNYTNHFNLWKYSSCS